MSGGSRGGAFRSGTSSPRVIGYGLFALDASVLAIRDWIIDEPGGNVYRPSMGSSVPEANGRHFRRRIAQ